jgi:hypothetical protein
MSGFLPDLYPPFFFLFGIGTTMFWAKVLEMSNKVLLSFLSPVFNERYLIFVPIKDNKIYTKIRINKKII